MSRRLLFLLLLTFWFVYLVHFNPNGGGSRRFTFLTMALVERGSIDLSPYHDFDPGDIMPYRGRYYTNTNPGLSFLAAPAWALFSAVYLRLPEQWPIRAPGFHSFLAHLVSYAFTTALMGALTALMVALFVHKRTGETWRAVCAACLYAFGTTSFFLSTRLNQNVVVTFLALALFMLVFEPGALGVVNGRRRAILMGFAAGLGIFVDLSITPFLLVMALPICRALREDRRLGSFALATLVPVACLMFYQWLAFQNPVLPAQSYIRGFLGPASPNPGALLDHLILPTRGLFLYMPFTALAIWYFAKNWRAGSDRLKRQEKIVIAALFGVYLVYVSVVQSSVFSGYGPRYLLPVLPYVCIMLGVYLRRSEETLAIVLAGISLFVQMVGAQCGRGTKNMFFEISLWLIRGPWLPVGDWLHDNTFIADRLIRTALHGNANPAGLLLMLAGSLLILWTPYWLTYMREEGRVGRWEVKGTRITSTHRMGFSRPGGP